MRIEPSSRRACRPRRHPIAHSTPKVNQAIAYIGAHLTDPRLTVGGTAEALDIHPDYLAHLFTTQYGERMSHYIATTRVALAKRLLRDTNWQIKCIARKTGHANPNWFSHVFRRIAGISAVEHRQRTRYGSEATATSTNHTPPQE